MIWDCFSNTKVEKLTIIDIYILTVAKYTKIFEKNLLPSIKFPLRNLNEKIMSSLLKNTVAQKRFFALIAKNYLSSFCWPLDITLNII